MSGKLKIDTTNSRESVVVWQGERYSAANKRFASQVLLSLVDQAVGGRENLDKITAIEIASGPGSFTGLRVGFSVGQLLGWQRGCLVNGQKISAQNVVLPTYDE